MLEKWECVASSRERLFIINIYIFDNKNLSHQSF